MLEVTVECIHSARSRRTPEASILVDYFGGMSQEKPLLLLSPGVTNPESTIYCL